MKLRDLKEVINCDCLVCIFTTRGDVNYKGFFDYGGCDGLSVLDNMPDEWLDLPVLDVSVFNGSDHAELMICLGN